MNIRLEHISCDLCDCQKYKIRYKKPDNWLWLNQFEYPIVECIDCGLVYVNPRPTQEAMSYFYPKDYHNNRNTTEHLNRYAIQTEFLPNLTNEKILDIGCARGDFLIYLKKIYPNIKVYGNDYYSDRVNSTEITFINMNLPDCGFFDEEFDLITAWAVFEHLHNPGKYFQEVSRILKKYGKFVFLVTNSESLYGKRAYIEDIPRHTYHFSEKLLTKYAHKYGFNITRCYYDDRIFDGRGSGTFYYLFTSISGVTWEKRYFNKMNFFQRKMGLLGSKLDKIIFKYHWEARLGMSGIMIVE